MHRALPIRPLLIAATLAVVGLASFEQALAQHPLPGMPAPRVRGRYVPRPQRSDPPPQYGARQPMPRSQATSAPSGPPNRPTPAAAATGPTGGVERASYQTINRGTVNRAENRVAANEREIFYDDPQAPHEQLPAPTAPQGQGPPQGPMPQGNMQYDMPYDGGPYQGDYMPEGPGCGPNGCGGGYDDGYGPGPGCGPGGCGVNVHGGFQFGPWWQHGPVFENLTLYAGTEAFKAPPDNGANGNFGFQEGINYGGCVSSFMDWGYQIGAQAVQTDLSGYNTFGVNTSSARSQVFVTAGLFRRFRGPVGFQWGVVYDYLSDDYYVHANLGQIRGEISFRGGWGNEIGFWFTTGVTDDDQPFSQGASTTSVLEHWETTDLYAIFWRRQFCSGATARIWGGATGNSDGLIGGEFEVPLSCKWSVSAIANYKIPGSDESANDGTFDYQHEAWGVGMNLIWYIGGSAQCSQCNPFKPLFNVANNATMMVDRERFDNND
ncbi:MAG: hypothetical protein K1X74_20285 [Pirellulales bacterium]|nr:hypothetical protein [Pirellulales bacterium]